MVQTSDSPLLDPAHLARIEDLILLAKVVVNGNFFGLHRSRRQGHGNEFFQYRNYELGEDLKNVDWKVYAKRGELVSKTYHKPSNANLMLVLDASASMAFRGPSSPCSKFRYAQMLAACLAYLAHRQGDRIGLLGGSNGSLRWMFPSSGSESFKSIVSGIGSMVPSGSDMADGAWHKFKANLPAQATVVVISDFLENEEKLKERLSFALSPRYDCLCVQVLDPTEEDLPEADALRFYELEGVREVSVSPARIRARYRNRLGGHLESLSSIMASTGCLFTTVRTKDDLGHGIRRFLGMRGVA